MCEEKLIPPSYRATVRNLLDPRVFDACITVQVSLRGELVCLGTCTLQSRPVLRAPPQLLTDPYFGVPMQVFTGLVLNP